jgi:voltage-gated potassium channel Kch
MFLAMSRVKVQAQGRGHLSRPRRVYLVAVVVYWMFFISLTEIAAWAAVYLLTGALQGIEKALYFSTVTFTTLGYGDITLGEQWRLLAAFEAANGIIMFGWTTAIVIATVQRVYFGKK